MKRARIHLDHASGTPVLPAVERELAGIELGFGIDPAGPYAEARRLRAALDRARDRIASELGRPPAAVVLCSCGTEAVNLAILGAGRRLPKGRRAVAFAADHRSVIGATRRLEREGHAVSILPVDPLARADPDALPADTGLVSISMANAEVGTLQPVAELARAARRLGALLHVDAAQCAPWLDLREVEADLLSVSGHKIGAGRGGVLACDPEIELEPVLVGGPQERGRRAGWEDAGAAMAMAVALEECQRRRAAETERAARRSAQLAAGLARIGAEPTGAPTPFRLPNLVSGVLPGRIGEDLVMALDLAGIAAASGPPCASGSLDPSHVLAAMGRPVRDTIAGLRLSTGYSTTDEEVAWALERILELV